MTTLNRCLKYLNHHHVPYTHTIHPTAFRAREVASAEHLAPYQIAKTVVFCGDGVYAMAVLPADCAIDVEGLAAALGLQEVRLATEEELSELFPHAELGAMPPLGKLFNLPVYLDERLNEEKHIVFNAGTHRDSVHMSVADYVRLTDPLITHFAEPEVRVR